MRSTIYTLSYLNENIFILFFYFFILNDLLINKNATNKPKKKLFFLVNIFELGLITIFYFVELKIESKKKKIVNNKNVIDI